MTIVSGKLVPVLNWNSWFVLFYDTSLQILEKKSQRFLSRISQNQEENKKLDSRVFFFCDQYSSHARVLTAKIICI